MNVGAFAGSLARSGANFMGGLRKGREDHDTKVRRHMIDSARADLYEAQAERARRSTTTSFNPDTDPTTQRRKYWLQNGLMKDPTEEDEDDVFNPETDKTVQRRRYMLQHGLAKMGGDEEDEDAEAQEDAEADDLALSMVQSRNGNVEQAIIDLKAKGRMGEAGAQRVYRALVRLRSRKFGQREY